MSFMVHWSHSKEGYGKLDAFYSERLERNTMHSHVFCNYLYSGFLEQGELDFWTTTQTPFWLHLIIRAQLIFLFFNLSYLDFNLN